MKVAEPADADDKSKECCTAELAELPHANGADEQVSDAMRWCHGCWQAVRDEGGSFGTARSRFDNQWFCKKCWHMWRFQRQPFGGVACGDDDPEEGNTRWQLRLGSTCCSCIK